MARTTEKNEVIHGIGIIYIIEIPPGYNMMYVKERIRFITPTDLTNYITFINLLSDMIPVISELVTFTTLPIPVTTTRVFLRSPPMEAPIGAESTTICLYWIYAIFITTPLTFLLYVSTVPSRVHLTYSYF